MLKYKKKRFECLNDVCHLLKFVEGKCGTPGHFFFFLHLGNIICKTSFNHQQWLCVYIHI